MNGGVIKVGFAEEDNVGMIVPLSDEHREIAAGCTHSSLELEILLLDEPLRWRLLRSLITSEENVGMIRLSSTNIEKWQLAARIQV